MFKNILQLKLNFFTKTTQVNLITQVCQKQQQQQTNKKITTAYFALSVKLSNQFFASVFQ